MGFLLGVMKCKTDCGAGCQTLNILNSPYYLNTLKGQILHMISILMELLFKIKKKKNPDELSKENFYISWLLSALV